MDLFGGAVELQQVEPEARPLPQPLANRVVDLALRSIELRVPRGRTGEPDVLAEVEGDLAVIATERPGADPDELATRAELVQPGRAVFAQAARQDVALPGLGSQGDALQGDKGLAHPVRTGTGPPVGIDVLPARQEAGQLALVGRLDLVAQAGEAGAAQPPQDVGLAPLARATSGQQLAAHDIARALELLQRRARVDAVAVGELAGGEGHVRGGVAPGQSDERVLDRLQEALRQTGRRRNTERIAIEPGVLGGDVALLARDPDDRGAALLDQLLEHRLGGVTLLRPCFALLLCQVAEAAEDLLEAVAVLGAARFGHVLELL